MGFVVGTGATSPESARAGSGVVTAVTGNSITVAKDANDFVAGEKLVVSQKDASITTWTWSGWVKFSEYNGDSFFSAGTVTDEVTIYFDSDNKFRWITEDGTVLKSTPTFNDPAKWTHVVIAVDTTQLVESDRIKVYIDNERITEFVSANYPSKGYGYAVNKELIHAIGEDATTPGSYITDGYMTDINFVDGLQLEPSEFASALSGEWEPKRYHGRYGHFGWNLYGEGDDSATNPETSAITNIQDTAITADYADMVEPVSVGWEYGNRSAVFDGNTGTEYGVDGSAAGAGGSFQVNLGDSQEFTDGTNFGKELRVTWGSSTSGSAQKFRIEYADGTNDETTTGSAGGTSSLILQSKPIDGIRILDSGASPYYATISAIHLDGVILTGTYVVEETTTLTLEDNTNLDLISSGTTVQQISGEPIPETPAFTTTLYTGTGNSGNVVDAGIDFSDTWLIWLKSRSQTQSHYLTDSLMVKTTGEYPSLSTNTASAQSTTAGPVDITGTTFTYVGSTNDLNETYVAWSFRGAPGFFDVVTWEGTGDDKEIPHSLNSSPGLIITKSTSTANGWFTWHNSFTNQEYLVLNEAYEKGDATFDAWGDVTDESFGARVAFGTNTSNQSYVAYLFADTPGKIKCGAYQGTGSSFHDIDCGFEPAFVLIKVSSTTGDWRLHDNKRLDPGQNNTPYNLRPNKNSNESAGGQVEFTSTGFRLLATSNEWNADTESYVYLAIADGVEVGGLSPTGEVISTSVSDTTLTISNVNGTWGTGSTARSTTITFPGNFDDSGNANNWTGAGFVELDVVVDGPETHGTDTGVGGELSSNYATLNPLATKASSSLVFSQGNLRVSGSTNHDSCQATFAVSTGKWYWEVLVDSVIAATYYPSVGAIDVTDTAIVNGIQPGDSQGGICYMADGQKFEGGSLSSYGSSYTQGDVIGMALDMDAGTLVAYKNGVSQGTLKSGITGRWTVTHSVYSSALIYNFGATPFTHAAPADYKALTTSNLPTSLVPQSETAFDTVLYNGTGKGQTVDSLSFKPDFVWIKSRTFDSDHELYDSVRGPGKLVYSSLSNSEISYNNALTSFTDSGFTLGDYGGVNKDGEQYVAWCWKASNQTTTNVNGSLISQVSANPTTGFSVVTYTGTGSNATVGHGLGAPAKMILLKNRDRNIDWAVFHSGAQDTGALVGRLNTTDPFAGSTGVWQNLAPTSNTFSVGNDLDVNTSGEKLVAYCWSEVPGFSSFGSFVSNNSTDNVFVYTGFEPRYVLWKRSSAGGGWFIYDSVRNTNNPVSSYLEVNSAAPEGDVETPPLDFLSNGFKVRNTLGGSETFVYAAFAAKPF